MKKVIKPVDIGDATAAVIKVNKKGTKVTKALKKFQIPTL